MFISRRFGIPDLEHLRDVIRVLVMRDQKSRYQSWQDLRYNGQANSYVAAVTGASADAKANPLQFQQDDEVNVDTRAAFAHVSFDATDRLTLTGGLRYTDEHKDYTYVRLNHAGTAPATVVGALNGVRRDYDGDNLDYRAALQFAWNSDVMTYLQYATGFKGGGVSPRPFVADQAVPFGPEKLGTYEAGIKSDLLGRRVRLNAAVFFCKYTDLQLGLQNCSPPSAGPS